MVTVLDLRPRVIDHGSVGTSLRRTVVDPRRYQASRLVAELADAWIGYSTAMNLSPGTAAGQAGAVRSVGRFLTSRADRTLSLSGSGGRVLERLHAWEQEVVAAFPPPSMRAKKLGGTIRRLVAYWLEDHELSENALASWSASGSLDGFGATARPLDEFSNAERLLLRDRFRQIVRDGERLLAYGDELYQTGQDPRVHGWGRLADCLWAARNLAVGDYPHPWGPDALSAAEVAEIVRVATGVDISRPRQPLMGAVRRLVAPDADHLSALRCLVHLETGWAPEQSKWLRRGDVEFTDGQVQIRTVKNRAHRVRFATLTVHEPGGWGWRAGDLLARARHAMRHAWAMAPDADWFWTCGGGPGANSITISPEFGLRRCTFDGRFGLGGLVRAYDIDVTAPYDLRRIRKTVKSARAVLLGTLNGAAGDDQTVEVYRNHYLPTSTVHTIAAQTVISAQHKVLDRALGPTLVTGPASRIAGQTGDEDLSHVAETVESETPADQELAITGCRDPYDPPSSGSTGVCMDAPTLCLRCPNAIIFTDHLPRLVAYRRVLLDLQKSLPPQQFHEVYGQQLVNIDDVLAKFPTEQIQAAEDTPERLHLPLSERYTR